MALKSILAANEIEIPRTRDLEELLELVKEGGIELPEGLVASTWLTPWATTFRYQDLDVEAALEAATSAIGLAQQVLDEDSGKPSRLRLPSSRRRPSPAG